MIGNDYNKGIFNILIKLLITLKKINYIYFDIVVSKKMIPDDKMEMLRLLAMKLQESFLRCEISHSGNINIFIDEINFKERKVYFTKNRK